LATDEQAPPRSAKDWPPGVHRDPPGRDLRNRRQDPSASGSSGTGSGTRAGETGGGDEGGGHRLNTAPPRPFHVDPAAVRAGGERRTTCMLRNVPAGTTAGALQELIDEVVKGKYDCFILPTLPFQNDSPGFAAINFVDPAAVVPFFSAFHGRSLEEVSTSVRAGKDDSPPQADQPPGEAGETAQGPAGDSGEDKLEVIYSRIQGAASIRRTWGPLGARRSGVAVEGSKTSSGHNDCSTSSGPRTSTNSSGNGPQGMSQGMSGQGGGRPTPAPQLPASHGVSEDPGRSAG